MELSSFDIAVVEPLGHSGLQALREAGTVALAYLSVMELPPEAPETRLLGDGDFLHRSGHRLRNEEYGNFLADLRSPRWTGLLLDKAGRLLDREGYDGLFLDTVANVEQMPGVLRDSLLVAAASFVKRLRTLWPDHILVQNNGLGALSSWTASLIDGLCWENPRLDNPAGTFWVKRLAALQSVYGLKVFLLFEDQENNPAQSSPDYKKAEETAAANGFLIYRAPFRYIGPDRAPLPRP